MTRGLLLLLVMLAAPLTGLFFGGAPTQGVSTWTVAAAAACVLLADLLGPPRSAGGRIGTAVLAGVLFAVGYSVGLREQERAVTEVSNRAEELRRALEVYHDTWSEYPDELSDLDVAVPGKRILRGDLLDYERTLTGYRMTFEDGFGRYEADHRHGFLPVK